MRRLISRIAAALYILAALMPSLAARAQSPQLALVGPNVNQLVEGRAYRVRWSGSEIRTVSAFAEGKLTSRPDKPRGYFTEVITQRVPASQGSVVWRVPFLDTVQLAVKIKGYDAAGHTVARSSRVYFFSPAILSNRTADGIYIDLRSTDRQRLYRLHNNIVTNAYLTSGSRNHRFLTKNQDSPEPHDHVGVFRVMQKFPLYWSNEYGVWMTHAMRFWKGHFIHGTYPNQYYLLGRPASSGCVRLDRRDAKELYDMTPIGTRVEILGD